MKLLPVLLLGILSACGGPRIPRPKAAAPAGDAALLKARLHLGSKATVHQGEQSGGWLMAKAQRLMRSPAPSKGTRCGQVKHSRDDVLWLFPGAGAVALQLGPGKAVLWTMSPDRKCVTSLKPPAGPAVDHELVSLSADDDEVAGDMIKLPGLPGKARVLVGSQGYEIVPSAEEASGTSEGEVPEPPKEEADKDDEAADAEEEDSYKGELQVQAIKGQPDVNLVTWTVTRTEGGSKGNESVKTTVTATLWWPREEGRTVELYEHSSDTNTFGGGGGTCAGGGSLDSKASLVPWGAGWLVQVEQIQSESEPEEPKDGEGDLCAVWIHKTTTTRTWRYVGLDGTTIDLAQTERTTQRRGDP